MTEPLARPGGGADFDYNYFGIPANYVTCTAQIRPSPGRDLSSAANGTVNVIKPGAFYPKRTNQLDVRAAKTAVVGARLQGMLDLYNLFNSNGTSRLNGAYGSNGGAWLRPQAIVPGRPIKFGAQRRF